MMIPGQECFAIWAPEDSVWAQWAKPVIFASVVGLGTDEPPTVPAPDTAGALDASGSTAVVVDLPGAESVTVGLAFAQRGLRPVPLYNGTDGPNAVVKTDQLIGALGAGSQVLKALTISRDARPAFLLDSNRSDPRATMSPGYYDNRWVVLPQDFPSAMFLRRSGITDVLLVQRGLIAPSQDLSHVLLRWQQGGLRLRSIDLTTRQVVDPLVVGEPSFFRKAWYAAIAVMGLRRNNVGGFGSMVPEQTQRSGFYG
jgi:hypothetical protein